MRVSISVRVPSAEHISDVIRGSLTPLTTTALSFHKGRIGMLLHDLDVFR
jgi:hypothetical protein